MIRLLCSLTVFFMLVIGTCAASPKNSNELDANSSHKPSVRANGVDEHASDEDRSAEFSLKPFQAEYVIKVSGITVGKLTRSLSISESLSYEFNSEAKASGLAALFTSNKTLESSLGYFLDEKIQPERYAYDRFKGSKKKSEYLVFDDKQNLLEITRRGVVSQRPLSVGGLDKLSYQLQLMIDLGSGNDELAYTIETPTKVKTYLADRGATENISTPLGNYVTKRVEQRNSGDKQTTFWCAEALLFLPIKVLIKDGDEKTEIILSEFRFSKE